MSIGGIESIGAAAFQPLVAPSIPSTPSVPSTGSVGSASSTSGTDFGSMVLDGIDRLDGVQKTSDQLAVQAATGDLTNIHDYTIAATQAAVTTQVTVAIRNKAVEAFNEIMRMQV